MTPDIDTGLPDLTDEWKEDSMKWRGVILTGRYAHWCFDYDGLPMDETCPEWPCDCRWEPELTSTPSPCIIEG